MCDSTNDHSSFKLHGKFHPEDVEKWINQLANVKLTYLKLDLLISTLKVIAESERRVSSETAMKIKKAVLFGDIGEYVEFSSTRSSEESKGLSLLGIPKELLAAQKLALNGDERTRVMALVEEKLEENVRSIMKIFKLESGEHKIMDTERIKQIPARLENFVNAHKSTELMFTFYNRYRDKIQNCHYEIIRMGELSRFFVDERVKRLNPCIIESFEECKRYDQLMVLASRCCSASIRKEIFSPDTVEALHLINKRQLEEIEEKDNQIETLKKQVVEYETLYPDGFESLLKEYLEVEKALKSARLTLKALESQNHDDCNHLDV